MKNMIWLTVLLFIAGGFNSNAQTVKVKGKVIDKSLDSVWVCFNNNTGEYEKFEVDKHNEYSFSFAPKKAYNFIYVEEYEIVLQPGDSVCLSFIGDSIATFSGDNSTLNQCLLFLQQEYSYLWDNIIGTSFLDFQNKLDYWYEAKLDHIDSCFYKSNGKGKDLAVSYLHFQLASVGYAFLNNSINSNDTTQYNIAIGSEGFKNILELKNFNDTLIGQSLQYYLALKFFLRYQMNTEFDENKSYLKNIWDIILEMNLPKENNDVAYFILSDTYFKYGRSYYDHFYRDADSILHYFEMNAFDKQNAEFLKNSFEQTYDRIRPGRQIPDIELHDTLGNKVLLSDFKDKIIYIKFWSTGCAGCIKTIPEYNELLSSFNDTNIVFMSIAIMNTNYTEQWKNAIRKHNLKGLNFISAHGLGLKKYGLYHGLPRYYIIGRNNAIIDLRAPCPGSAKLKAILEAILSQ